MMAFSYEYRIQVERKSLCKWQHCFKQGLFTMGFGTGKRE